MLSDSNEKEFFSLEYSLLLGRFGDRHVYQSLQQVASHKRTESRHWQTRDAVRFIRSFVTQKDTEYRGQLIFKDRRPLFSRVDH